MVLNHEVNGLTVDHSWIVYGSFVDHFWIIHGSFVDHFGSAGEIAIQPHHCKIACVATRTHRSEFRELFEDMDTPTTKAPDAGDDLLLGLPVERKAAKVRALLPRIEKALAEGVSHADIHSQLNNAGFDITLAYYHLILKRLRKEAKSKGTPQARGRIPIRELAITPQSNANSSVPGLADVIGESGTVLSRRPRREF